LHQFEIGCEQTFIKPQSLKLAKSISSKRPTLKSGFLPIATIRNRAIKRWSDFSAPLPFQRSQFSINPRRIMKVSMLAISCVLLSASMAFGQTGGAGTGSAGAGTGNAGAGASSGTRSGTAVSPSTQTPRNGSGNINSSRSSGNVQMPPSPGISAGTSGILNEPSGANIDRGIGVGTNALGTNRFGTNSLRTNNILRDPSGAPLNTNVNPNLDPNLNPNANPNLNPSVNPNVPSRGTTPQP